MPSTITINPDSSNLPEWRMCTMKMFPLTAFQCVLQTYFSAYFSNRDWFIELVESSFLPWAISLLLLAIIYATMSTLGTKLRNLPGVTIPLFFVYIVTRSLVLVITTVQFLDDPSPVCLMTSLMQMCVCIALSLYSCCMNEHFTTLYSHIFFGIMLAPALGCSIALYLDYYMSFIGAAIYVAIWASFISHNLMAIHE